MSLPEQVRSRLTSLDVTGVGAPLRRRLVELWLARGQNEHASIASFNRFALSLLAVGAPPELLEQTQAAALDEIRHAQICFAIASRYAGRGLGPGALSLGGLPPVPVALAELVEQTVIEGCVGETLSALEARALAEAAREPAIEAAMDTIASDELRHAELAWGFVGWAAEQRPELRAHAARTFAEAARADRIAAARYACLDPDVTGLGFLTPGEARRVRVEALEQVLRPAALQLGFAG